MSELQPADRFRYLETLGETNLAHTRLAVDELTGKLCAVKSIKLADVDDEKVLERPSTGSGLRPALESNDDRCNK